ncbi:MAG: hypothetical protein NUW22_02520 [Acidobacteria bacterium]|nr:hypothetical protein [Acidobacteriota bacterium]
MRRVAAILGTAAVVLMTASVFAQTPNFAGKWTADAEKNAAAMGGRAGRGGMGGDMTIAQDAKTLTITRTTQAGEFKTVYMLDGTESKNMMAGRGGGAPMEQISVAKWDGAKLTITTGQNVAVYAMDGAWLTIATTRPGRGGGEATTTTLFYKKAM